MAKLRKRRPHSGVVRASQFSGRESYKQTLNRLMNRQLYENARVEVVRKQLPFDPTSSNGLSVQEYVELLVPTNRFAAYHGISERELAAHMTHIELGQSGLHGTSKVPHGG